jgi:WD40 repeat protein
MKRAAPTCPATHRVRAGVGDVGLILRRRMRASIRTHCVVGPVTALCASQRLPSVVYSGVGGVLTVHNNNNNKDNIKQVANSNYAIEVFQTHSIHGIKEVGDRVIVFGDKSVSIYRWDQSSELLHRWAEFVKMPDLVLDVTALNVDCTSIVIGYAHNFIESFRYSGDKNTFQLRSRVQCPVVCVLFSMSFGPFPEIEGKTMEVSDLVVASGTSFGKLILWKACPSETSSRHVETTTSSSSTVDAAVKYDASTVFENASTTVYNSAIFNNPDHVLLRNIISAYSPQVLQVLLGHEGVIFRIVWSPDGHYIATVSDDRTVRIWSLGLGKQVYVGWGHVARLWDVVFVGDGWHSSNDGLRRIATCSEDGTIRIWDAKSSLSEHLKCTSGAKSGAQVEESRNTGAVDSSYLKTAVSSDNARQANLGSDDTQSCICVIRSYPMDLWRVVLLPEDNNVTLVCGSNDGCLRHWDLDAHLIATPFDPAKACRSCEIPDWSIQVDDSNNTVVGNELNDDNDDEEAVELEFEAGLENEKSSKKSKKTAKKPSQSNSRRLNGACSLFVSPAGNYHVVVLLDGSIWLVTSGWRNGSDEYRWNAVYRAQKPITAAAVHFHSSGPVVRSFCNSVQLFICAFALPDGVVSSVAVSIQSENIQSVWVPAPTHPTYSPDVSMESRNMIVMRGPDSPLTVIPGDSWRAHEFRVVCMAFIQPNIGSMPLLATFAAYGVCRFWSVDDTADRRAGFECITGGKANIATSAAHVSTSPGTAGQVAVSPGTAGQVAVSSQSWWQTGIFVVGDSRGCISVFAPPSEDVTKANPVDNGMTAVQITHKLRLVHYFTNAHGTDPVACVVVNHCHMGDLCGQVAFFTAGHDGDLHIYRHAADCRGQHCFELVAKQTCLPVRTPTFLSVLYPGNVGEGQPSVVVGGFQGSLFIVWDLSTKRELMRAEGGSWKRPHAAVMLATGEDGADTCNIRTIFTSAVPLKLGSALALCDNKYCRQSNSAVVGPTRSLICGIPIGLSQTGCCTAVLSTGTSVDGVCGGLALVGGEEGVVHVLAVNSQFQSLSKLQELQMHGGTSAKTLSIGLPPQDCRNDDAGIVVAAGGRLNYNVWRLSRSLFLGDEGSANHDLFNNALAQSCSGSIWPNAPQDHRILCSSCRWVLAAPTPSNVNCTHKFHHYCIVFGDSRGRVTVSSHCERETQPTSAEFNADCPVCAKIKENRSRRLTVIEDLTVSEYPIATCAMEVLLKRGDSVALIACFGDTNGCVFIWRFEFTLDYNISGDTVPSLR